MPAVEIHPGKSVGVALPSPEGIGTVVSGHARCGSDSPVVLPVRIGELAARPGDLSRHMSELAARGLVRAAKSDDAPRRLVGFADQFEQAV